MLRVTVPVISLERGNQYTEELSNTASVGTCIFKLNRLNIEDHNFCLAFRDPLLRIGKRLRHVSTPRLTTGPAIETFLIARLLSPGILTATVPFSPTASGLTGLISDREEQLGHLADF